MLDCVSSLQARESIGMQPFELIESVTYSVSCEFSFPGLMTFSDPLTKVLVPQVTHDILSFMSHLVVQRLFYIAGQPCSCTPLHKS